MHSQLFGASVLVAQLAALKKEAEWKTFTIAGVYWNVTPTGDEIRKVATKYLFYYSRRTLAIHGGYGRDWAGVRIAKIHTHTKKKIVFEFSRDVKRAQ